MIAWYSALTDVALPGYPTAVQTEAPAGHSPPDHQRLLRVQEVGDLRRRSSRQGAAERGLICAQHTLRIRGREDRRARRHTGLDLLRSHLSRGRSAAVWERRRIGRGGP